MISEDLFRNRKRLALGRGKDWRGDDDELASVKEEEWPCGHSIEAVNFIDSGVEKLAASTESPGPEPMEHEGDQGSCRSDVPCPVVCDEGHKSDMNQNIHHQEHTIGAVTANIVGLVEMTGHAAIRHSI